MSRTGTAASGRRPAAARNQGAEQEPQGMRQDRESDETGCRPTDLVAESDGRVGEAPPLSFKSPPLTVQLGPALLETIPLLQVVGVRQLGGRRRAEAILQVTNPVSGGCSSCVWTSWPEAARYKYHDFPSLSWWVTSIHMFLPRSQRTHRTQRGAPIKRFSEALLQVVINRFVCLQSSGGSSTCRSCCCSWTSC